MAASTRSVAGARSPPKENRAKISSQSADWVGASLVTAKAIAAAGECLPFPYVKVPFELVVILLQTVEVCLQVLHFLRHVVDRFNSCRGSKGTVRT